ncbi:MAG: hypothetical protein ACI9SK_002506 [Zhongshania sp.]
MSELNTPSMPPIGVRAPETIYTSDIGCFPVDVRLDA